MDVFITGIGVLSSIGNTVEENLQSLKNGISGIEEITIPDAANVYAATVKRTNEALGNSFGLDPSVYSRTSLLGIGAVMQLSQNLHHDPSLRTGIISATSVGGMDRTERYYDQLLKSQIADYGLVATHDSGNSTEKIAQFLGIHGYVNTLSTACSSAANAIMLGARLIEQNKFDRMLVGGVDPLTNFTIKGFQSLMIYDQDFCKPFDENRNGLNLGEGSAFLLLENEKSCNRTSNEILCKIIGWHNANDAYHQTASSPDGKGATLAMHKALEKAGLQSQHISYINAHGTGTKNNDLSESVAIKNVFKDSIPPFSSTKGFTGHTLAAAGAIEAVFSVLALTQNVLFPNYNFNTPIGETQLIPLTKFTQNTRINTVLSNSFGFGGNNTTLIFSKN
jgi:3-oxoacyl-[acyl-carrier-protein] synthase-1